MFSAEIDFRRDDTLSKLSSGKIKANVVDRKYIDFRTDNGVFYGPEQYFVDTAINYSP
jgi:hypothetical protein